MGEVGFWSDARWQWNLMWRRTLFELEKILEQ